MRFKKSTIILFTTLLEPVCVWIHKLILFILRWFISPVGLYQIDCFLTEIIMVTRYLFPSLWEDILLLHYNVLHSILHAIIHNIIIIYFNYVIKLRGHKILISILFCLSFSYQNSHTVFKAPRLTRRSFLCQRAWQWAAVGHEPQWAVSGSRPRAEVGSERQWAMSGSGPWAAVGHERQWAMSGSWPWAAVGQYQQWAKVNSGKWFKLRFKIVTFGFKSARYLIMCYNAHFESAHYSTL